jgi:uncharacterized OsmC-like protein
MPEKTVSINAKLLEGFKIEVKSRQFISIVDQPPAGGGTDAGPTPLDYLFVSLAGCVATIGRIIAKQKRLPVRGIEVQVEGDIDTDVLMGKRDDVRAGFSRIRVTTSIDADMTREEKEQFVREIDARCPISDNILNTSSIEFVVE